MRRVTCYGPLLLAALLLVVLGCNSSDRGRSFNDKLNPPTTVGSLRVHFPVSLRDQARKTRVAEAVREHLSAFNSQVVPVIQNTFAVPGPVGNREVFVYDVPYIRAPWALAQLGYVDHDKNYDIHVVLGHCEVIPDLTNQLTRSYYFPNPYNGGTPAIWASVALTTSNVVATLRVQRLCPH